MLSQGGAFECWGLGSLLHALTRHSPWCWELNTVAVVLGAFARSGCGTLGFPEHGQLGTPCCWVSRMPQGAATLILKAAFLLPQDKVHRV